MRVRVGFQCTTCLSLKLMRSSSCLLVTTSLLLVGGQQCKRVAEIFWKTHIPVRSWTQKLLQLRTESSKYTLKWICLSGAPQYYREKSVHFTKLSPSMPLPNTPLTLLSKTKPVPFRKFLNGIIQSKLVFTLNIGYVNTVMCFANSHQFHKYDAQRSIS